MVRALDPIDYWTNSTVPSRKRLKLCPSGAVIHLSTPKSGRRGVSFEEIVDVYVKSSMVGGPGEVDGAVISDRGVVGEHEGLVIN